MNARILKNLVPLLIAITIFAGGFYIGGGFKMLIADKNQDIIAPKISKEIPQYRNNVFLPIGNKISVNNLPVELGYFTTRDDISTIKDELIKKFNEIGLKAYFNQVSDEEGFIKATDIKTGEHKIVILKRSGDETMVFAGITPLVAENLIVKPDTSLGIPPDAINYIEVKNQDYGRSARTISFQLKGTKEKNLNIFKESLKRSGYEENDYFKKLNDESVLSFVKENRQIMAIVTESEDENQDIITSFVLNVMEKIDDKD